MRFLWILLLPVLALMPAREAPADGLEGLLASYRTLAGEFRQQLHTASGELLEESRGSFSLRQPGQFRWHVVAPDEQLLLLADDRLLHYDVALATATLSPVSGIIPESPLLILGGEVAQIREFYEVEEAADGAYDLWPLDDDSPLTRVNLQFAGDTPESMTLHDRLGQITEIQFSSVALNPTLSRAEFQFDIPAGVDVLHNDY